MRDPVLCDYCLKPAELVKGDVIYPHRHDLACRYFYRCVSCSAYVGCHPGSRKPLGRLANAELRAAKMAAHAAFEPLWKRGQRRRGEAYGWLAAQLGIDKKICHIGMFDVNMCRRVIDVCSQEKTP